MSAMVREENQRREGNAGRHSVIESLDRFGSELAKFVPRMPQEARHESVEIGLAMNRLRSILVDSGCLGGQS